MREQPWTEKYKPMTSTDFVGNKEAMGILKSWLERWGRGSLRKRALLLTGPTGVGKTEAVYIASRETGYDVVEINATDNRSKNAISQLLRNATVSGSLIGKRGRVILIDELEGLSNVDRGAVTALGTFIKETRVPMILVTSDPTDRKITALQRLCQMVEFKPIPERDVVERLEHICINEKLNYEKEALEYLAKMTRGDLRAAINDLQIVSKTESTITVQTVQHVLGWRDRTEGIKETLDGIFYAEKWEKAIESIWKADADPEELLRWISNNVPLLFSNTESLSDAYHWLSRSSIFKTRIRRTQNWGLLPYFMELMCINKVVTGIKQRQHREYQFPEWIRQMAWSKRLRRIKKSLGELLSPLVHISQRRAWHEYTLLLHELLTNKDTRRRVIRDLNLPNDVVRSIIELK